MFFTEYRRRYSVILSECPVEIFGIFISAYNAYLAFTYYFFNVNKTRLKNDR